MIHRFNQKRFGQLLNQLESDWKKLARKFEKEYKIIKKEYFWGL